MAPETKIEFCERIYPRPRFYEEQFFACLWKIKYDKITNINELSLTIDKSGKFFSLSRKN